MYLTLPHNTLFLNWRTWNWKTERK